MSQELKRYVKLVRADGVTIPTRSVNGGGWIKLARAAGSTAITKSEATRFLREKFCSIEPGTPFSKQLSRDLSKRKLLSTEVTALERKLATPQPTHIAAPRSNRPLVRIDPNGPEFLQCYEWRTLRMKVLRKYGPRCMCCGATPDSGAVMNVDHIKPRRQRPDLALTFENLQVLCHDCNHGKGNWDQTDWRPVEGQQAEFEAEARSHLRLISKGQA